MRPIPKATKPVLFIFSVISTLCPALLISGPALADTFELISSDINTTVIRVRVDRFDLREFSTPRGQSAVVRAGKGASMLEAGSPDLGTVATSIIIPDKARMRAEVISSRYKDYADVDIAPSKGSISRCIDPATVPYKYGEAYSKNKFFPGKLFDLQRPFIFRDHRGQSITVYPFQYNPKTRVLRVYNELVIEISVADQNGENPFVRIRDPRIRPTVFGGVYERFFLNYQKQDDDRPIPEQGTFLIISAAEFMSEMEPLIAWKKQKGIHTTMEDISQVGNQVDSIKQRICDGYANEELKFVLFVGDYSHITAETMSGGAADPTYGYCEGSDRTAEVLIGRFSGENTEHIKTQVEKVLHYETGLTTADSAWLQRGFGSGGTDGTNDWGDTDFSHIRDKVRRVLMEDGLYTDYAELYDGSQGGEDESGDPSGSDTQAQFDRGIGNFFYSGHGMSTSLMTGGLSTNMASSLTNGGQKAWPHVWCLACNPGEYNSTTCVAEGLMRASGGAVSSLMSSTSQSWNPPYLTEMEWVAIMVDNWEAIVWTLGAIASNGYIETLAQYPNDTLIVDTWITFGDPTMIVHTGPLEELTPEHPAKIPPGAAEIEVTCPVTGALMSVTDAGEILGTAYSQGAALAIPLSPPVTDTSQIKLTITAKNKVTYVADIEVGEGDDDDDDTSDDDDDDTSDDDDDDTSDDDDDDTSDDDDDTSNDDDDDTSDDDDDDDDSNNLTDEGGCGCASVGRTAPSKSLIPWLIQ